MLNGMFKNEMQCLSNSVLQFCVKRELKATWGIVPMVRKVVEDNKLPLDKICHVRLWSDADQQCIVHHAIIVTLEDGQSFDFKFQSGTVQEYEPTYTLYDRERDGVAKYLHLVH